MRQENLDLRPADNLEGRNCLCQGRRAKTTCRELLRDRIALLRRPICKTSRVVSTYSAGAAAAHSRMIVGWQLASDLRTDPVLEALKMAVVDATRAPASN